MHLNLTDDQVVLIIGALNYRAQMEAGQTQAPDLCDASDYDEYDLAIDLHRRLALSIQLRNQWVLNEQTGERTRRRQPHEQRNEV